MSRRRSTALAGLLLTSTSLTGLLVLPSTGRAATPDPAAGAATVSRTISRTNLVGGADVPVDSRSFSLTVGQTLGLRDRQQVSVSWSGAHPTGNIYADANSGDAAKEEYPVVLLECRGVEQPAAGQQAIDPTTCWTQTSAQRFKASFNTSYPVWRSDRYAGPDQRAKTFDAPTPLPDGCSPSLSDYWVPFVAASGVSYPGGSGGCGGTAPEASDTGGLALPSNTTYGVTHADGTGSASFDLWTTETNTSLGCTDTVACSLVAVPVEGISCDAAWENPGLPADQVPDADDAADAAALCQRTGQFAPGSFATASAFPDDAVSGQLWWAASNWRNRVSVPLHFAQLSNVCDVTGGSGSFDLYGSEIMGQATTQWSPAFCLDPNRFRFKHVQTGEPEARNILNQGSVEAALTSDAPADGFTTPTVQAPVALSGFAIAFAVDDAKGVAVQQLRLTPRLVAKLLSESYPAVLAIQQDNPALARNPLNISLDPEFIALNPGITQGVPASVSAATLLQLAGQSDVITALTSWMQADPEARAWLDGAPDPWGMVVNPAYQGISLPTDTWPILDTFVDPSIANNNACLAQDPVPYLPLVASPVSRLASIALDMQFVIAQSQVVCQQLDATGLGAKLVALGRQTAGFRFMLGVTSLGDAERYALQTASLQTSSTGSSGRFTDATGRTFADATTPALLAAATNLQPDETSGIWTQDWSTLRQHTDAYPGTMMVYADVPTTGLPAGDGPKFAQLLRFAASDGQVQGFTPGDLPPGYAPLTSANGMDRFIAYTNSAADAVQAQAGTVPMLVPVPAPASSSPPAVVADGSSGTTAAVPSTGTDPAPAATSAGDSPTVPEPAAPAAEPPAPDGVTSAPAPVVVPATLASVQTPKTPLSGARLILPVMLLVGLVAGLGALVTAFVTKPSA